MLLFVPLLLSFFRSDHGQYSQSRRLLVQHASGSGFQGLGSMLRGRPQPEAKAVRHVRPGCSAAMSACLACPRQSTVLAVLLSFYRFYSALVFDASSEAQSESCSLVAQS